MGDVWCLSSVGNKQMHVGRRTGYGGSVRRNSIGKVQSAISSDMLDEQPIPTKKTPIRNCIQEVK
jgi:hypothetical protein